MHEQLRKRLIGATILVSLGVIFIPMILDRTPQTVSLPDSPVPAKPAHKFEPIEIPLEPPPPPPQATAALIDRNRQEAQAEAAAEVAQPPAPPPGPAQGTIQRSPPPAPSTAAAPAPAPAPAGKPAHAAPVTAAAPVAAPTPAVPPGGSQGESWIVQVGSFSNADNAAKLKDKLRGAGFPAFIERAGSEEGRVAYKVRVGPMVEREEADNTRAKLSERMSLAGIVVRYR